MKIRWNNMIQDHSITNLRVSILGSLLFIIIVTIMACTKESHKSQLISNGAIKEISAEEQTGKKEIEENTKDNGKIYTYSSDFLNSTEGVKFQVTTWRFAKAFFCSDKAEMKKYLKDGIEADPYEKDVFLDIEYLILKWSLDSIWAEDRIGASYQFQLEGEDSDTYLSLSMEKVDGEWKVASYGLEK